MPRAGGGAAAVLAHVRKSRGSATRGSDLSLSDNVNEALIPLRLEYRYRRAMCLQAAIKLSSDETESIQPEEVRELFSVLGEESPGIIQLNRIIMLLLSLEPPCSREEMEVVFTAGGINLDDWQSNRVEEDIVISCADFLKGIQDEHFLTLRAETKAKRSVSREVLVREIEETVSRDDAFSSAPATLLFFILFSYTVIGHLDIFDRTNMQDALKDWTNGRDPRKTCSVVVEDIDSFWGWLLNDGLEGPFLGQNRSSDGNFAQYHLASQHILFGDVKLTAKKIDEASKSEWLLHTNEGRSVLSSTPNSHLKASINAATFLKDQGWGQLEIEHLMLEFTTYSEASNLFGFVSVSVTFGIYGNVVPIISSEAVAFLIFHDPKLVACDVSLALLVLYILVKELKDIYASLWVGGDSCLEYLQFWNVVDLTNILGSFVMLGILLVLHILAAGIADMKTEDGTLLLNDAHRINVDVMDLTIADIESITNVVTNLRNGWRAFKIASGVNTGFVTLKFFKAFQSNYRLKVVTDTFRRMQSDLYHFLIVFFSVYIVFAIVGHLMFGSDIEQFSSLSYSINACLTLAMGDFAWYVDVMDFFYIPLPSGMPKPLLFCWYTLYAALVCLTLLNMFLAIVMEHYCVVSERNKTCHGSISIIQQVRDYVRVWKETRGFMSLSNVSQMLGRDEPVHEEEVVTEDSLVAAFDGMTHLQADYILTMIEGAEKSRQQPNGSRLVEVLQEDKEKIYEIGSAMESAGSLTEEKEVLRCGELDELTNSVKQLTEKMSLFDRQQYQLSKRVGKLTTSLKSIIVERRRNAEGKRLQPGETKRLRDPAEKSLAGGSSRPYRAAKVPAAK